MIKEDAPVNNVGSGAIAGAGVGAMGEPGVSKKAQRRHNKDKSTPTPVIINMLKRKAPNSIVELYGKGSLDKIRSAHYKTANDLAQGGTKQEKKAGALGFRHRDSEERTDAIRYHMSKVKKADRLKKNIKEDCDTFAGAIVFEVSSSTFHNAKTEKRRGKHWRTYLDECDELAEIREYANKHPKKPIVLRNRTTSEMVYVRYGKAR